MRNKSKERTQAKEPRAAEQTATATATTPRGPEPLWDVETFARLVGRTARAIYAMVYRRQIPEECYLHVGGRLMFAPAPCRRTYKLES